MIDTAGTLCAAAEALRGRGARRVVAYATHSVFSGPAIQRIDESELDQVVVTDTIPLHASAAESAKIEQISVAPLIAEAIRRIHHGDSVSSLFV